MGKNIIIRVILLVVMTAIQHIAFAQLPCQNGPDGLVYIQNSTIQNYDPSLPISATNPVTNTIPNGGGGLAVANNLNGPGPSPTFYAVSGSNWVYWNGATWVNTGHSAGATINTGGGGNYLYNLNGSTGDVWQYDGTGPSTLLLTVPGFLGGGPYDLVGDCDGGFYILRTDQGGVGPFLRKYSLTGALVQSWTVTGSSNSAGGGFAIANNTIFYHNGSGFHSAPFSKNLTNIAFTPNPAAIPGPSDMACCPVCDKGKDTLYYCQGAPPLTLSTSIASPTWTVISGNTVITGSGASVSALPSTVSLVTATSLVNTSVDSFVLIPVNATVDAGSNGTIKGCDPYADTLNGTLLNTSVGITYNIAWTPAANIVSGINTLTPAISQTGLTTYTLTVSTDASEGGCLFTDTVVMDVDDFTPFANFDYDVRLGCEVDTIAFTNTSTLNPNGSPAYSWNFGNGNFSILPSPTHFYGVQGDFAVKLTVTDNGCVDDTTIMIDIRHPLVADFDLINNGLASDDSICLGNEFTISPTTTPIAGTANMQFDWDFGDGTIRNNAGPLQQTYIYPRPGTYTIKLTITDTLGCQDSTMQTVFVDIPPYAEISAKPTTLCLGQTVHFVDSVAPNTFLVTYDFGDGNILNNLHNPSHAYMAAGNYTVTLYAEYLICPDTAKSLTITVNDFPQINLGDDITLCPGLDTAVVLENKNNPSQILTWSTGVESPSISVNVNNVGKYWARAENTACITTDSILIKRDCYLNIPNSFSPNGDGLNDYFLPRQLLSSGVVEFTMKIMNRWGEFIYETNAIDGRGWDGRLGAQEQPLGVYVYLIEAKWKNGFRNTFMGNVTLMR